MTKIAIIDKAPSKINYSNHFEFEFDQYHLSSVPLKKVLKKDVDIEIDLDAYEYIILVGSEAVKNYCKTANITDHQGYLLDEKFIPLSSPAILYFRPEAKPMFDKAVDNIHRIIEGYRLESSGDFRWTEDAEEANKWLMELLEDVKETGELAIDTETTAFYPRDGYVLGISLSAKEKKGVYISSDVLDESLLDLIQEAINIAGANTIYHNAKFDRKMIKYHFNFKLLDKYEDTILQHYTLKEDPGTHGLKHLALKYTEYGDYDAPLEQFKKEYCRTHKIKEEDFTYDLIPFNILGEYAAKDAAVTLELHHLFRPLVTKNPKLENLYTNLLIPASTMLEQVEDNGIPIDKQVLEFARDTLNSAIDEASTVLMNSEEVKAYEAAAKAPLNPNSPTQLRKFLFDFLNLNPLYKLTGTGLQSTDKEVLEDLQDQHPLVEQLVTVRKLSKMKNTYVDKILPQIDRDSCVRTGFNLINTTSGRLSSSGKFNAQQLPRDEFRIKGAIRAPEGYKIVSQDLKTAEVYIAAVVSKDKKLQEVFKSGGDLHATIAKMVFNLPCPVEEVKEKYPIERQSAKAITFGILYGSGPDTVASTVNKEGGNLTKEDAIDIIKQYFETFPQLKIYLENTASEIMSKGYLYTSIGRKRRLGNITSPDKGIVAHEVRSGINAAIQAPASDINVLAVIDLLPRIKHLDAKVFMLVHDSIVAIVKDEHVEEYCAILKEVTQKDRGFSISGYPIGVDQEVGQDYSFGKFEKTWGEQYKCWISRK